MVVRRNFKYRIYPSIKQIVRLNKSLLGCCFIYNKLLELKINIYMEDKTNLSQFNLCKLTKKIDVGVYAQAKQNICKRINDAFKHFYRRLKSKKGKPGFPRFKSVKRYKSITYPQGGFNIKGNKLCINKIGNVPIILHRKIEGKIKTLTIKKSAKGWFVIFSCEDIPINNIKVKNKNHIGIDLGINSFATLSNGSIIKNPKYLKKSEIKIKKLSKRLSRKKKGSKNRIKAIKRLARHYERVNNQRQDFLHKESFNLVKRYKNISIEDLKIKNMVKNRYLAKSISDASWGYFTQMLSYKVERTGGRVTKVNPKNTTKTCSKCGNIQDMPLSKRKYKCLKCGFVCDRDLNASINIDRAGQVQISTPVGDDVRPSLKANVNEAGTIFEENAQP